MKKETLQAFCLSLQGATHDYQPEWQADRYHIGGKMFAMMGGDVDRKPVITLKCDPQRAEELREMHEGIIPGYYMNKTHWNSIYLDADIPSSFVEELIEHSYQLVFHKLTKKAQQAILQHNSKETD
ncbi:MmcQ/YjbR family DNA-binding protein [Bacillus altitudinis]|jgi:predicted DNA-binding protein (MmcQ/YjbR family)|uniref:MmcQ/YjbR family DNA-binding protein n=1 Tax=Bacillus TaxID=1386 RepID=UPI00064E9809|nr:MULTISPECIES: MmcQ/YjbR family DNA-binding protein [Bacillus]KML03768.1 MmcQ [Bacillus stratosphericus]MBW3701888.1 MmcQ/YjbR family DNA-binding protein [Bacillus aerophilus]MDH8711553.1 putative DNA-binding protein (MmcQ/YjbR family) [Micromonospora sp. 1209]ALM26776.1 MmcQ [Bacillus altitudinis]ALM46865.1 MmcQ [Bacillus altitudinis]